MTRLVLVLGDQLTPDLSALAEADRARDVVVMAEVAAETEYVWHHRQKIVLFLSAMRHFAQELEEAGWKVAYTRLDDEGNSQSISGELLRRAEEQGAGEVLTTLCGDWRLRTEIEDLPLSVTVLPDRRFICDRPRFEAWAEGRKSLRMEYFYREMRRETGLLMDGDKPAGGEWNYDAENRKPASDDLFIPKPFTVSPDAVTQGVIDMIADRYPDGYGTLDGFGWAVTRGDAEAAAVHFFAECLRDFGTYQDAMLQGQPTLWHAVLSPYLNLGLLDPLDLCKRAAAAWEAGDAPLNAAEGFIRQILGWREFVRGVYDLQGPDYLTSNALGQSRDLPEFYWTADTEMACMADALGQTRDRAYAHHIQRLMVTGNFALLAGIDPAQVHAWYLAVYADAVEWVEAPNTLGMSQFADGGLFASKPYVSSGKYIDRMSDYCSGCTYAVGQRAGDGACPFNALYWYFLDRQRDRMEGNPRMAMIYRTWDRMAEKDRADALASARDILDRLDRGDPV
ncbi:cryptochrome/photolyase family protein [Oceanomicrobium pacificus]|uniref:cryptochrome/photolyase family protein n=1 Tax=Oceanomicrobium pacificus TaxID=2692916 RepID=UPI002E2E3257|nr:cryptochrome/photolyase family protein [Oceanomicrobium pacificus]